METGQEELVQKDIGRNLIISPNTTRAAYTRRQDLDTMLTVASVPDGQVIRTWRIQVHRTSHLAWSSEGEYLAYVLTDDAREIGGLWFQKLNSDTPRQVADLSGEEIAEMSAFSLSDDGKHFAVIKGNWKHDAVLFRGLK